MVSISHKHKDHNILHSNWCLAYRIWYMVHSGSKAQVIGDSRSPGL